MEKRNTVVPFRSLPTTCNRYPVESGEPSTTPACCETALDRDGLWSSPTTGRAIYLTHRSAASRRCPGWRWTRDP